MKKVLLFSRTYWGLLLVLGLSFFAIRPLFAPGFFPIHDSPQIARMFEMGKSLKDDMLPVRWVSDLGYGYGYPIFNFYAPLPYYVGGLLVVFGINALLATKIAMIIGILTAGVAMYALGRMFWDECGGVIAGVLYMYGTYHAVEIFVRGDISEFWAYGIIPLVFWGFSKLFVVLYSFVNTKTRTDTSTRYTKLLLQNKKDRWLWIFFSAISYAMLILAHNLTALMVSPFLLVLILWEIYMFWRKGKIYLSMYVICAFVVGLFISAFYWLPALGESQFTNVLSQIGGAADFHKHFVCLQQFWYSPWGYGGSAPGCIDGLSFAVGKIYFALIGLSIVGSVLFWRMHRHLISVLFVALISFVISLWLQTAYSAVVWNILTPMAFFQYPWRFLVLTYFFASFMGGSIAFMIKLLVKRQIFTAVPSLFIIGGILFLQAKLFVPQQQWFVDSTYYTNRPTLVWQTSKISDEYLPKSFIKPISEKQALNYQLVSYNPSLKVQTIVNKTQQKEFLTHATSPQELVVHVTPFPAWYVFVDDKAYQYTNQANGVVIMVPKGSHNVLVQFAGTILERFADGLSLCGILILFLGIIPRRRSFIHE